MTRRKPPQRDLTDPERRKVVQGGLLAAAAALGFLPGCSEGEGVPPVDLDASPAAAGSVAAPGAPSDDQSPTTRAPSAPVSSPSAQPQPTAMGEAPPSQTPPTMGQGDGQQLPRAILGKTGVSIPIVGLGTSRLGQRGGTPNAADFDHMVEVFSGALDLGIEYIDTGAVYGRAEEALGLVLEDRRDDVFLVTKLYADSYTQAKTLFERSLQRLKTDHVDLLHLHSVGERDLDLALSEDGAWRYILEQKESGKTRFVGITGHNNPDNFMRMLATDQVDVLMTIMNFVDHSTYGFTKQVREEALSRGVGVMAMKVYGGTESILRPGGGLANANAPVPHPANMSIAFSETVLPDCMRFVKGLGGITGMVIGVNALEEVQRNIRWAIETEAFTPDEMAAIIRMGETVAPMWAERYG